MSSLRLRGRHYATGAPVDVTIENGVLARLDPAAAGACDHQADFIAPAYFDLQINGGLGVGFTSAQLSVGGIRGVVELCQRHGLAGFCPTVVTNSFAVLKHSLATLRAATESDPALARALPRFHLEGPYIAADDGARGAHPKEFTRAPDEAEFQSLQEAAGGRIGLVTLAPELPGALPFIEQRVSEGLVVSIGHSAATPGQIRDAVAAGARLSTHLGNGCARTLPRHENLLWEQLAADELSATLITDGFHLPWSLVRCFIRMKEARRIILISDASEMAGLPPGRYGQWAQEVEVLPEGKIILCGQGVLAGSWLFTDQCVSRLAARCFAPPRAVLEMAGANPRRLLGLPVPTLAPGEPADVVLLDGELGLMGSVIGGKFMPPHRSL
jgi:N-acetylglucosamine-6-phosphate deacetylase